MPIKNWRKNTHLLQSDSELENRKTIDMESIKNFYNAMPSAWPEDYYSVYTRKFLMRYVSKHFSSIPDNSKILNAGSGGTVYPVPGEFYHLDVAKERIQHLSNYKVGSIENIPYPEESFDYIICVGTVINYVERVEKAFQEFRRVLKPQGRMILEYERCHSGLIPARYRNRKRFLFHHEYFHLSHENYLYSDSLINGLLNQNGFKIQRQEKYQSIVPMIALFTEKEKIMEKYSSMDVWFRKIPFLNSYSHSRIILCQKRGMEK